MEKQATGRRFALGPGLMVTAAFIGPGTVTTAWIAGSRYQLSLLWVIVLATVAAMVLQEMAARLGVLTGRGLGEILRRQFPQPVIRTLIAVAVIVAIGIGNAAYQTGNLLGAAIGLQQLVGLPVNGLVFAAVTTAAILLATGSYRTWEGCLIGFVALMGITFVISAGISATTHPIPTATLVPTIPSGSWVNVLALIGTTIVPYNLFLHASSSAQRWSRQKPRSDALRAARRDCVISLAIGGIVTAAILCTAAVSPHGSTPDSVQGMAAGLSSALGDTASRWMFAAGLAAAGLTSAITAPLAAAFAISGVLGWANEPSQWSFRAIWIAILACGAVLAVTFGESPLQTIVVAQAANAILLPCIAGFLWMVCNAKLLGQYRNGRAQNVAVAGLLISLIGLSTWNVWKLF